LGVDQLWIAVAELFARQDGVASISQLRALGLTRAIVRRRLDKGEWFRVSQAVVGLRSTALSWRGHVRAAWLDAGEDTSVSHTTAGRLHRFDGLDRNREIHLTVCGDQHRTSLRGVTVHRSKHVTARMCTMVDGMRVVSKPVALVQIAALDLDAAEKALDGVLRDGASSMWLRREIEQMSGAGVKAAAQVLDLLLDRVDRKLPRSWFQRLAKRVLKARRIELVDEHEVRDPVSGRILAELDLAHPELMIGVECQSWKWHSSPGARVRDARRKRRLRLLGWELVEVWWDDLRRVDEITEEVIFLIDQRTPRLLP
jgi:hypothetical protein